MLVIVSLHHYNHNGKGLLPRSLFRVQGISSRKRKKVWKEGFPWCFFSYSLLRVAVRRPCSSRAVCLALAARCRSGAGRGGLCGGEVRPGRWPQQSQCQRLEGPELASCSAPSGSPKPGHPATERLCRQRGLCAGWDLRVPASQK